MSSLHITDKLKDVPDQVLRKLDDPDARQEIWRRQLGFRCQLYLENSRRLHSIVELLKEEGDTLRGKPRSFWEEELNTLRSLIR